jgi:hypothetical protein
VEANAELPERPPKRSFIRRMSTRVGGVADQCRYTALKMPRRDYKKYFARDRDGNYAGTEPEKEWSDAELKERFGAFQDMPLRSIPGGQEYGEGAARQQATIGGATSTPEYDLQGTDPAIKRMNTWGGFEDDGRRDSLI